MFGSINAPRDSPDDHNAQILLQIVGGNDGRLTQELREKRGLTLRKVRADGIVCEATCAPAY